MVRSVALCLAVAVAPCARAAGPHAERPGGAQTRPSSLAASSAAPQRALLDRYCITCHNQRLRTGGLTLDTMDVANVGEAPEVWEKMVQQLRGAMMPPVGRPRPDPQAYEGFRSWLEASLDRAAAATAQPGGEIFAAIRDGIEPDFAMDTFRLRLAEPDIWNLVSYVKTLR